MFRTICPGGDPENIRATFCGYPFYKVVGEKGCIPPATEGPHDCARERKNGLLL